LHPNTLSKYCDVDLGKVPLDQYVAVLGKYIRMQYPNTHYNHIV
jgi:hypothetical protein